MNTLAPNQVRAIAHRLCSVLRDLQQESAQPAPDRTVLDFGGTIISRDTPTALRVLAHRVVIRCAALGGMEVGLRDPEFAGAYLNLTGRLRSDLHLACEELRRALVDQPSDESEASTG